MNNLKRLALAISLAVVLAGTVFAGELNTPPCTTDPGELNTPPCPPSQLLIDDTVDRSSSISSEVNTLTIATAISAIESLLTVY